MMFIDYFSHILDGSEKGLKFYLIIYIIEYSIYTFTNRNHPV